MISRANLLRSVLAIMTLLGPLAPIVGSRPQSTAPPPQRDKTVVLWIREVRGQALYWVNHTPANRAPLSGIVAATQASPHYTLTVIIDSRVPIRELAEIQGLVPKLDVQDVRYYVYDAAHPKLGMSELVWKMETLPLPQSPPSVPK